MSDTCTHPDSYFDRSICPEPCDMMHDVCTECGMVLGYCPYHACTEPGPKIPTEWDRLHAELTQAHSEIDHHKRLLRDLQANITELRAERDEAVAALRDLMQLRCLSIVDDRTSFYDLAALERARAVLAQCDNGAGDLNFSKTMGVSLSIHVLFATWNTRRGWYLDGPFGFYWRERRGARGRTR